MPKLPEKIEDWLAPWESQTGGNTEIDPDRLKRYLFGILQDKEKAQHRAETSESKVTELEGKLTEKSREGETETDRLKRELKEAQEAAKNSKPDSGELLRLRVALKKGLSDAEVARLVGNTEEELSKDADELLKLLGRDPDKGKEGDKGEEGPGTRRTPTGRNPSDPNPDAGRNLSTEDAIKLIPRVR